MKFESIDTSAKSNGNNYDNNNHNHNKDTDDYKTSSTNPFSRVYTTNEIIPKDGPEPTSKYTINTGVKTSDASHYLVQKQENIPSSYDYKGAAASAAAAASTPQEIRIAIISTGDDKTMTSESTLKPIIKPVLRDDSTIQLSLITPR